MPAETRSMKKAAIARRFHPAVPVAVLPPKPKKISKKDFLEKVVSNDGWTEIQEKIALGNPLPTMLAQIKKRIGAKRHYESLSTLIEEHMPEGRKEDARNLIVRCVKEEEKALGELWKSANRWGLQEMMQREIIDLREETPELEYPKRTPTPDRPIIDLDYPPYDPDLSPSPLSTPIIQPRRNATPGPSRRFRTPTPFPQRRTLTEERVTPEGVDRYGERGWYGVRLNTVDREWEPVYTPEPDVTISEFP